ncbi:MAG: polysulfide reductase NrfD [Chloroflexi bacterium]|nr:polysulfide reductase NrfD [Chloroflexota bacterium]
MELIPPQKQKVWKWPAATNFTLGGIGTGLYIAAWLANAPEKSEWLSLFLAGNANWFALAFNAALFKLLAPALVAIGVIALTSEAGRPQRGINLFRHLRRSWMSRETLAFALFAPLAGLDFLFPNPILRALAALSALALMVCQGMIVYRARGVMTWNTQLMPWFFIASGWSSGAGLYVLVSALAGQFIGDPILFFAITGAVVNLVLWLLYLQDADENFRAALRELRQAESLAQSVVIGHALPAVVLLYVVVALPEMKDALIAAAGIALLIGAFTQKFGIILRAGYLRAIRLAVPSAPARPTTAREVT